jgi:nickel transport protein
MPYLLFLLASALQAHELEITVALHPPAAVARAAYGGSEPVAFASYQVFAPGAASSEFQNGRTDKHGYLSVVPDGPGVWRIVVDDEEGHRAEVQFTIPDPFAGPARSGAPAASRWERALLGVSLIAAATGVLYGFKARARPRRL